jgi:hypothetical protein
VARSVAAIIPRDRVVDRRLPDPGAVELVRRVGRLRGVELRHPGAGRRQRREHLAIIQQVEIVVARECRICAASTARKIDPDAELRRVADEQRGLVDQQRRVGEQREPDRLARAWIDQPAVDHAVPRRAQQGRAPRAGSRASSPGCQPTGSDGAR